MLKELFHEFKWLLALTSLLSVAGAFASVTMLSLITKNITNLGGEDLNIQYSFGVFVVAVVTVMAFDVFSKYILLKLSSTIVYDVRKSMLQRILATNYQKIEKIGGHRLMAIMDDDVGNFSDGLLMLPSFFSSFVTVLLCLGYLIYSSWELFICTFIFISLIIVLSKILLAYGMVHQTELREKADEFYANLQALTNGGKEVTLNLNRRRYFYSQGMLPLFESIRRRTIKSEIIFISLGSVTTTLVFFMIGTIVYGSRAFLPEIQIEVIVSFVLIILYMVGPLTSLVGLMGDVNEVRVSVNKIERLTLAEKTEFSLPSASEAQTKDRWTGVTLEDVTFKYEGSQEEDKDKEEYAFSLGPVSAEFKSGEVTFITGGNGSGKTTFAKLISGLYSASSGNIFLSNNRLIGTDISLESYQNSISSIFSDFFVFKQMLNNQGEPADDEQVKGYLNKLKLDKKVSSTKGLLSSTDLSQGQKKRLMLLQSYLSDAQVCLYDECAADQDPEFKRYFYTELLPKLKSQGKIVIIISHDDHYFYTADKVLKFVDGVLV